MLNERVDEGVGLGTEIEVDALGTGSIHDNERKVGLSLSGRKIDLGLLSSIMNTLDSLGVAREIEIGILLRFGGAAVYLMGAAPKSSPPG